MAHPDNLDDVAEAHQRLASELDALLGGGVLLDPAALRRLRATVDAVMPAAEAYERRIQAEAALSDTAA
jgi:hypothetical protein